MNMSNEDIARRTEAPPPREVRIDDHSDDWAFGCFGIGCLALLLIVALASGVFEGVLK
jgi:hypothetical protein